MNKKNIYFVEKGKRQPFYEWLSQKKENLDMTWKQFDNLLGVKCSYRYCNGKAPVSPKADKLALIASSLEYNINDFVAEFVTSLRPIDSGLLKQVAETALELGRTNLSTTFVRGISEKLYSRYKITGGMDKLAKDINDLDPSYSFMYVAQKQLKTPNVALSKEEEGVICDVLLDFHVGEGKNFRSGVYKKMQEELESLGYNRTIPSLQHYSSSIWNGDRDRANVPKFEQNPQKKENSNKHVPLKERVRKLWETTVMTHGVPLDDFYDRIKGMSGGELKDNSACDARIVSSLERKIFD